MTDDHAPPGMTLELRDVVLSYGGAPVVDGLDLTCAPGEILVLTGPSGCGKSTVLRALAGLLRTGRGRDPGRRRRVAAHVPRPRHGVPGQRAVAVAHRAVQRRAGAAAAPDARGRAAASEALRWIADVGLTGFEDYLPKSLSGGMRQRVQLARGLAGRPAR